MNLFIFIPPNDMTTSQRWFAVIGFSLVILFWCCTFGVVHVKDFIAWYKHRH